jgi:hypothetical protein
METRLLSPDERRMLSATLQSTGGRQERIFAAFLAGAATLAVGLLIAERLLPGSQLSQALPVGLALAMSTLAYRRTGREPWREKQAADLRAELAAGVADIGTYAAQAAVRVDEFEDEGISYFVHLVDGRVLFLAGQYLYEFDEDKQFPNTAFTIVRTPLSRMVLGFEVQGSYFAPMHTREPFTDAEYRQGSVPSDGDVLEVDFQSTLGRSQV